MPCNTTSMVSSQLIEYIRQQLLAGAPREQIVQVLLTTGWLESDINEAFISIDTVNDSTLNTAVVSEELIPTSALPRSNRKIYMLAGLVVVLFVIIVGGIAVMSYSKSVPQQLTTSPISTSTVAVAVDATTTEVASIEPVIKHDVTFEKQFEISALDTTKPRGYIDASIEGKRFWVVNGKLAYVVTYFGPNNTSTSELFYDGKKVNIHDGATNYPVINDFINGVPEITDKLSYYTFNLDKFFFGDEVYPKEGVIFDAQSINGKLAVKSQSGFSYDGQTVETDYKHAAGLYGIGGKVAYIRPSNINGAEFELMWDGKHYASGAYITEVVDFQGMPAYIDHDSIDRLSKAVVMYKGQKISKEYPEILDLKVIGGKLAFIAQKNAFDKDLPNYEQDPRYVLVWGGKEYGTQYDSVWGYIDSVGVPAYIAANFLYEDEESDRISTFHLVRGDKVLFSGKPGEEQFEGRELADVDGNPAVIVRSPATDSLYVWYTGKKFFEGYQIYYVRNVGGKLAVLAEKDRIQSIFMEK